MKPYVHAQSTAKKFGGQAEDYLDIHDLFDSSKAAFPDMRHRAIYHHSMGIFLVEKVFGTTRRNSDGVLVQVRDIGEQHVLEDMGRIPTLQDYLQGMPFYDWLGGAPRKTVKIPFKDRPVDFESALNAINPMRD